MSLLQEAMILEAANLTKIVTVGVVSGTKILTGKRRDNGLWTSPGGHVDEGEGIFEAAIREVKEESGLDVELSQLSLILSRRVLSHRTGAPFVVFAFLVNLPEQRATGKADPDKEITEWKWVDISPHTPELAKSARHAKDDFILQYLKVEEVPVTKDGKRSMSRFGQDPRDQGRSMQDVSKSTQNANTKESPEPPAKPAIPMEEQRPAPPEPKALTPEQMQKDPEEFLRDENATGD